MKKRDFKILYVIMVIVMMSMSSIVLAAPAASTNECFITDKLARELKGLFDVIKILAAVVVVVLTIMDVMKVVLKPDQSDKEKGSGDIWRKIILRAIVLALIFFLTPIINMILGLFGMTPLFCGII